MAWRIGDPDRFQKISSGIQSIVLTIAILVGAVWTLYVFESQLQVESARLQLEKLRRELGEQANIETTLRVTPSRSSDPRFAYLSGFVSFKNLGNRLARLPLSSDSVEVARVMFSDSDDISFDSTMTTRLYFEPGYELAAISVFPGSTNGGAFIAKVPRPGVYLVSAYVEKPQEEAEMMRKKGAAPDVPQRWGDSVFVRVE